MKIGKTAIQISKQGLGCMGMSEFYGKSISQAEGINLIRTAFQHGVNFFDTADIYAFGDNEILVGKAIETLLSEGAKREEIVVATKCGIVRVVSQRVDKVVSQRVDKADRIWYKRIEN